MATDGVVRCTDDVSVHRHNNVVIRLTACMRIPLHACG